MELVPEWAPNIHPIIVHFPIAILILAVLMDLLDFFLPADWWDARKSTILYGIGALSAVAAYYTGTLAADSVFLPAGAQPVLNEHAGWAWWTLWFFGIYVVIRLLLHWLQKMTQESIRVALLIIALPGLFLLYETGDHGAKMVFGYGVGTGKLAEKEKQTAAEVDSLRRRGTTFVFDEQGNGSWPIGPDGVSTFLSRFNWLEGSASEMEPAVVQSGDNYLLQLTTDSASQFFVIPRSIKNVQVDYYVDLSEYTGEISFVSHVQDARNYDFVSLSTEGTIAQGRVQEGNREIFAESSYKASGMLFVRTVVNGTHFRAYINKELAVHGHGDAPEAGAIGLRLEGSGKILIDAIEIANL